ncbi:SDR family NAD(P)-dependent oxidoreductase [Paenibacillus sp. PAMC21692]|uniref:SDR family NAD(P)-dependent oxidoreductase n=1 Tax=Paenibacillus sp. PAMC21692 TaxID=2762320 RepID=UPI00164E48B8|nr:SDR family NAD(P)-dependent oxidoreductase [Paenibacillus sp. PAMC21692]QNK55864.1 SDR family NAD(P)-dependent oxidoreductase [Paenibacillus sp. PAMC21692]
MNPSGHTVFITGGASGIGLALTEQFVRHGNKVIVAGRSESKLSEVMSRYPEVHVIRCDISEEGDMNRLVKWLSEEHPDLSVLINNVGIQYNYDFNDWKALDTDNKIKEETEINFAPISDQSSSLRSASAVYCRPGSARNARWLLDPTGSPEHAKTIPLRSTVQSRHHFRMSAILLPERAQGPCSSRCT